MDDKPKPTEPLSTQPESTEPIPTSAPSPEVSEDSMQQPAAPTGGGMMKSKKTLIIVAVVLLAVVLALFLLTSKGSAEEKVIYNILKAGRNKDCTAFFDNYSNDFIKNASFGKDRKDIIKECEKNKDSYFKGFDKEDKVKSSKLVSSDGKTAKVKVIIVSKNDEGKTKESSGTLELVKEDGKWRLSKAPQLDSN